MSETDRRIPEGYPIEVHPLRGGGTMRDASIFAVHYEQTEDGQENLVLNPMQGKKYSIRGVSEDTLIEGGIIARRLRVIGINPESDKSS